MTVRARRAAAASLLAAFATTSTAACYTTRPVLGPPAPGVEVEATLNDRGRAALADSVGRDVDVVVGRVVERTDTSLVLAMRRVRTFQNVETTWTGERVRFPMSSLRSLAERRLARGQSVLLGLTVVGALTALILSRTLGGGATAVPGETVPPPAGS